jgi:hypothetical protein
MRRRTVRLQSIDDLRAEIDAITAAEPGQVRALGGWSPAQVLWHIGKLVIDYRSKASVHYGFPERNRFGPLLTHTFTQFRGVPNY